MELEKTTKDPTTTSKTPQGGAWQLLWEVNRSQGARDYSPYRTLCCSSAGVWQPPRYRRHITTQDRRAGGVVKSNYSGHRRPFRCRGFATPRNPSNIPVPFAQTGTGRGWTPRALKSAPMTGGCVPGVPSLALPSGGCESRHARKQPRRKPPETDENRGGPQEGDASGAEDELE